MNQIKIQDAALLVENYIWETKGVNVRVPFLFMDQIETELFERMVTYACLYYGV